MILTSCTAILPVFFFLFLSVLLVVVLTTCDSFSLSSSSDLESVVKIGLIISLYIDTLYGKLIISVLLVSNSNPPPKRKGGSGEYSISSHHWLAVAMDLAKI